MQRSCVYLLGAGGMGMAPLAQYLSDQGYTVFGWDDFASDERKAKLSFIQWTASVPPNCDVCVYSSAINQKDPRRIAAEQCCTCYQRGAFVAHLLKDQRLCVVCGSHGKSTTIAYLIHLFQCHCLPVNYIAGAEFQRDYYPVACGKHPEAVTLFELDESDGTIDLFSPDVAVILNTDWDHPRHYPTEAAYKQAFTSLASRTKEQVISNEFFCLPESKQTAIPSTSTLLGLDASAATQAFQYLTRRSVVHLDLDTFPGVRRRQEVLLKTKKLTVLSDYAHHPNELKALLQKLTADKTQWTVAFEPHRSSRLQCFFKEFVTLLNQCPHLYLHPLYEAFEVDTHCDASLKESLPHAGRIQDLIPSDWLDVQQPAALAFVGAGKIDTYARHWVEQWTQLVVGRFKPVDVRMHVSLKQASLMRIGGEALFVCEPKELSELQWVLRQCQSIGLDFFVLGHGANVLIPDGRYDGMVIFLNQPYWGQCTLIDDAASKGIRRYRVGAGCSLPLFLKQAEQEGVGGFEFLDGIPGTIGGALSMNAGTQGIGILDCVEQIDWVDNSGQLHTTKRSELTYAYRSCETLRNGVAVSAILVGSVDSIGRIHQQRTLLRERRSEHQPKGHTLGCFFKNPTLAPAGQLIDACGLKGMQMGSIYISPKHANFIVNGGEGRFMDVIQLVRTVRSQVYNQKQVWLEPEVQLLGKKWHELL